MSGTAASGSRRCAGLAVNSAHQRGDFDCLARVSHSQRGSSAVMGAGALAFACGVLEASSRRSDIEDVRRRLQAVETELERATAALRSEAKPH